VDIGPGEMPQGTAAAVTGLAQFALPVQVELEESENRIRALLAQLGRDSILPEVCGRYVRPAVQHLFRSEGKHLRPLLLLLAARSTGPIRPGAWHAVIHAAAAVELIHTASLAHDDMVDGSADRRGMPSLHSAYGNTTAVLVGDLFYARFFQELACLPGTSPAVRVRLLESFLAVTGRMCEGEILAEQMRTEGVKPSLEVYLHITEAKTADLMAACCRAGGLLNGAPERSLDALAGFGRSLGLLFQIADDLADGDGAFPERDVLSAMASEFAGAAEMRVRELADNEASSMLRALPAFILLRSRV
jgi:geranylgeranyl pyrophosphate synthase